MGRPRKPLTEQRGNLTVITMQTREAEEDSVTTDKNQLKRPPTWLIDNVAKKEWRRIVKELEKLLKKNVHIVMVMDMLIKRLLLN